MAYDSLSRTAAVDPGLILFGYPGQTAPRPTGRAILDQERIANGFSPTEAVGPVSSENSFADQAGSLGADQVFARS